jgi:hypothetical protein
MNSSTVGGACELAQKNRFPCGDLIPDAQLTDFIDGQGGDEMDPTHLLFAGITKAQESYPAGYPQLIWVIWLLN